MRRVVWTVSLLAGWSSFFVKKDTAVSLSAKRLDSPCRSNTVHANTTCKIPEVAGLAEPAPSVWLVWPARLNRHPLVLAPCRR